MKQARNGAGALKQEAVAETAASRSWFRDSSARSACRRSRAPRACASHRHHRAGPDGARGAVVDETAFLEGGLQAGRGVRHCCPAGCRSIATAHLSAAARGAGRQVRDRPGSASRGRRKDQDYPHHRAQDRGTAGLIGSSKTDEQVQDRESATATISRSRLAWRTSSRSARPRILWSRPLPVTTAPTAQKICATGAGFWSGRSTPNRARSVRVKFGWRVRWPKGQERGVWFFRST